MHGTKRGSDVKIKKTTELHTCVFLSGKLKVPKNTDLWFNSYSLHRNLKLYPDPEAFKPERFAGDTKPYTYMPFAEGGRYCIGKTFCVSNLSLLTVHRPPAPLLQNVPFSFVI